MMNLNELKNQLDQLGYYTILREEELVVGFQPTEIPDSNGISTFHFCCALTIEKNILRMEYELAAYSKYKDFSDISEVLDFIKSKFPML